MDASEARFEGDLGIPSTSNEDVIGSLIRKIASVFDSTSCPLCSSWIFSRASARGREGAIGGSQLVFRYCIFLFTSLTTREITSNGMNSIQCNVSIQETNCYQ